MSLFHVVRQAFKVLQLSACLLQGPPQFLPYTFSLPVFSGQFYVPQFAIVPVCAPSLAQQFLTKPPNRLCIVCGLLSRGSAVLDAKPQGRLRAVR